jgi:hypothetical protein
MLNAPFLNSRFFVAALPPSPLQRLRAGLVLRRILVAAVLCLLHIVAIVASVNGVQTASAQVPSVPSLPKNLPSGLPKNLPSGLPNKQPSAPSRLDSLSLDSLEQMEIDPETFRVGDDDLFKYYSHGWFAAPFPSASVSFLTNFLGFTINDARGITPLGTVPVRNGFSAQNLFDRSPFNENDHRRILKENRRGKERGDYESDYPTDDGAGNRIGLRFAVTLPIPLVLRASVTYDYRNSQLHRREDTKRYLGDDGTPQEFYEVNLLNLREKTLGGSIGVAIPIYGAFLKPVDEAAISSFYFGYIGIAADYALESRVTQYVQIADAKENLRYQNGRDTLRYLSDAALTGVRTLRPAIELAGGMTISGAANIPRFSLFGANFGGPFGAELTAEAYAWIPVTTVFINDVWRQATVGIRFSIGYQWLLN